MGRLTPKRRGAASQLPAKAPIASGASPINHSPQLRRPGRESGSRRNRHRPRRHRKPRLGCVRSGEQRLLRGLDGPPARQARPQPAGRVRELRALPPLDIHHHHHRNGDHHDQRDMVPRSGEAPVHRAGAGPQDPALVLEHQDDRGQEHRGGEQRRGVLHLPGGQRRAHAVEHAEQGPAQRALGPEAADQNHGAAQPEQQAVLAEEGHTTHDEARLLVAERGQEQAPNHQRVIQAAPGFLQVPLILLPFLLGVLVQQADSDAA
mmetsp:Transcript_129925/g.296198  ORF Transcript_129925/g.296198 Transcript_129925/m.296198 type:complete len:263 (-) Transcript_129925:706-1494(-)